MVRKIDFSAGKWNPEEWQEVKSSRWDYVHGFEQLPDHIANVTGCEGRNRFYDFTIESGLAAHDDASDGEH